MKPKIYNLYYSWYEEYSRNEFTHPQNKLLAEFQEDCQDLLLKYAPDFIKNGGEYNDRKYQGWIGASDFINLIASKLPELGYVNLQDTFEEVSFGVFGSNILRKSEGDEEIVKLLGEDLTKSTFEHNKRVRDRLNRRVKKLTK